MHILKRFGFYLAGLSIGLVMVTLFIKKKSDATGVDVCLLPNCRVLEDLRSKPCHYADAVQQMVDEKKVDSTQIALFFRHGDVDFGKSNTHAKPCWNYYINGRVGEQPAAMIVEDCDDKITVTSLEIFPEP